VDTKTVPRIFRYFYENELSKNRAIINFFTSDSLGHLGGGKKKETGNGVGQLRHTQSKTLSYQHILPGMSIVEHFQKPSKQGNFS